MPRAPTRSPEVQCPASAQAGGYDGGPVSSEQCASSRARKRTSTTMSRPPHRRMGIMAIAAVFALAVIGTAGAFGYRALFGSSGSSQPPPVIKADTAPSKIVPANASKAAQQADHRSGRRSRAGRKARVARRAAGRDEGQAGRHGDAAGAKTARHRPPHSRQHSAAASFPASRRKSAPSPSVPIRRPWPIANRWRPRPPRRLRRRHRHG